MKSTSLLTCILGFTLSTGLAVAQEQTETSKLRRENEELRTEIELLKKQNEKLKTENDLLKKKFKLDDNGDQEELDSKRALNALEPTIQAFSSRANGGRDNGNDFKMQYSVLRDELLVIMDQLRKKGTVSLSTLKKFKQNLEKSGPYRAPTRDGQLQEMKWAIRVVSEMIDAAEKKKSR